MRRLPPGVQLFGVPFRDAVLRRAYSALSRRWDRIRFTLDAAGRTVSTRRADGNQRAGRSLGGWLQSATGATNAYLFFARCDDWIARATAIGLSLQHTRGYDVIVSSGPPHMAHIAAERIGRIAGVPFVADLRDAIALPEVEPPDVGGGVWGRHARAWERRCLDGAALVIVNTDALGVALRERYPLVVEQFLTVMNGADPEMRVEPAERTQFLIAHTGSLYVGRDPRSLFEALAFLVRRRGLGPQQIRLHFMGDTAFEGASLTQLATEVGVGAYVTVEPTRPRAAVAELLCRAAVLVILPQSVPYAIPAKVFEYVQAPAWMLVLTERGTSVEALLWNSGADVVDAEDVAAIAAVLERRFDAFLRGERPAPLNAEGHFDRAHQAERLLNALDQLVPPRSPSGEAAHATRATE